MSRWQDRLPAVRGRLLLDEALAPFTWLRVGGPAEVIFLPAWTRLTLAAFLRQSASRSQAFRFLPLGVGSNTLVLSGDGGLSKALRWSSGWRPGHSLAEIDIALETHDTVCRPKRGGSGRPGGPHGR